MVKNKIIAVCCILFSLWMNACAAKDFIIDTDMGLDDVIAILYVLNRADVQVKAITISGDGLAHCAPALRNLQGLLQLAGKPAIPIACGRETPLSNHHRFPDRWRQQTDELEGVANSLPRVHQVVKRSALNLLVETLQKSSKPVDVLAIGPLTNLAELMSQHPASKNKIRRIYMMGGAVKVAGNVALTDPTQKNNTAEWNFFIDPKAADIVFRSEVQLVLVPLDLTNQVPIDRRFYRKLARHHSTPASHFIFELFKRNQKELDSQRWYFWDPLAAVIATDESIAKMREEKIKIMLEPDELSGATVINERDGNVVNVSVSVDKQRFEQMLLQAITK